MSGSEYRNGSINNVCTTAASAPGIENLTSSGFAAERHVFGKPSSPDELRGHKSHSTIGPLGYITSSFANQSNSTDAGTTLAKLESGTPRQSVSSAYIPGDTSATLPNAANTLPRPVRPTPTESESSSAILRRADSSCNLYSFSTDATKRPSTSSSMSQLEMSGGGGLTSSAENSLSGSSTLVSGHTYAPVYQAHTPHNVQASHSESLGADSSVGGYERGVAVGGDRGESSRGF
ncbi:hypothetical protein P152DRAFT_476847 [Eremomyces bilateralis CBS 781.70]|uniref:Uncharacterized protein n=1 Tax=Eremomyces bilateralis CBS 781.70 TaxID=1392243 RepID=A0A6G1FT05_9PEZI|nr:uncharacterized protein P152DRAFT_476847 [Eremomyces bilateralis CBS 781.70]KAF1808904.1 hypothetical protein P152DRAFT_476847 [Eremomyces bilateralis CBS 781.70]